MEHPNQPIVVHGLGIKRFKKNAIVKFLLDAGPIDMNQLARMSFTNEDRAQFAQLIGYSVSGWGGLPYVTDEMWDRVFEANHTLKVPEPEVRGD